MAAEVINHGKFSILGIYIHAVNYSYAVSRIVESAKKRKPFAVSALAVHGVMCGFLDRIHGRRLNGLDLVVPDGQPVRWALKWLHKISLPDRVYGPELTMRVARALSEENLGIYLYGSTQQVLNKFAENLKNRFPKLSVKGMEPSKFRRLTEPEKQEVVERITKSGACAVFVGLGCPRQEVWAYEYRGLLEMPILAVGAAFDFHAGLLRQAPRFLQRIGLEWLFRLFQEPRRLWKRYILMNPLYLCCIFLQWLRILVRKPELPTGSEKVESYG